MARFGGAPRAFVISCVVRKFDASDGPYCDRCVFGATKLGVKC